MCIFLSSLPGGIVSAYKSLLGGGKYFSGSERVCSGCEGTEKKWGGSWELVFFFFFFVLLER